VKESYLSLEMLWREFDLLGRGWGQRVVEGGDLFSVFYDLSKYQSQNGWHPA